MATAARKLDSRFSRQSEHAGTTPPVMTGTATVPVVSSALPGSEERILSALSCSSLTNTIMAGFIRDNGFASLLNRGQFYTCRDEKNELEGVALLGHTILFEAFSDRAIQAFAALARRQSSTHLLMGEHNAVERFWRHYADKDESPRLVCPVLFLKRAEQFSETPDEVSSLRPAGREDLEHVVHAQAAMALEISGVDPLKRDAAGFRERYLNRIEKKRVWVVIENDRLLFKADIIADTPEAVYIEGIFVSPEERGKGVGHRCLADLGRILMARGKAIYLFVETQNTRTRSFYLKLGFTVAGQYDLLYF
jgi:ribosomal protein S18 acetylase RimI-like enzyme